MLHFNKANLFYVREENLELSTGLIIFFIVLFVITLGITFYAFRLEEKKMEQYEREGDTAEDELKRSHEYETRSLRTSMKVQIWYYFIAVAVFIIGLVIYMKNIL